MRRCARSRPGRRERSAARSSAASSMSASTSFAPRAANARAMAMPMPLPPPVMTATRSRKGSMRPLTTAQRARHNPALDSVVDTAGAAVLPRETMAEAPAAPGPPSHRAVPAAAGDGRAVSRRASAAGVRRGLPGAPDRVRKCLGRGPFAEIPLSQTRRALGLVDRAPVVSRRAGAVRRRRRRPAGGRVGALQPDRRRARARRRSASA